MTETDALRVMRAQWRAYLRGPGRTAASDIVVGFAASFTIDPMFPYVGARLWEAGYQSPRLLNADYNQLMQVCIAHEQAFPQTPDALVLLWRLEDIADAESPSDVEAACETLIQGFRTLRERYQGMIVVSLPPRPRPATGGLINYSRLPALDALWHRACLWLSELSSEVKGLYLVDLEVEIARIGVERAHDARKALLYRQPYGEECFDRFGAAIFRLLRGRTSANKKCLVVDGDNTLWGGIIGEDGVGGVAIGQDFPGSAYREFQRQLKALAASGIFLALNSKNNPNDVWELFDNRPEMVLRREDFSVVQVNWQNKSANLRAIASELNIGIDSLVFVDDSHFELAEVNAQTPEVLTLQVPADVAELPSLLTANAMLFDRLDVTADDRKRVEMVRQESRRRTLSDQLTQDEFLASLGLQVNVYAASDADEARVVQLINKTNQFNLTTRRATAAEIAQIGAQESRSVYCLSVRDRFGDYGLVGIAITERRDGVSRLETLLMSCRVLGRGIETAFLSEVVRGEAALGAREVVGTYIPTAKNMMVADLYERHGFERLSAASDTAGETRWRLSIDDAPRVPAYLDVRLDRPERAEAVRRAV